MMLALVDGEMCLLTADRDAEHVPAVAAMDDTHTGPPIARQAPDATRCGALTFSCTSGGLFTCRSTGNPQNPLIMAGFRRETADFRLKMKG
jgi:hypothetical protein